jgi:hypothetical protein
MGDEAVNAADFKTLNADFISVRNLWLFGFEKAGRQ